LWSTHTHSHSQTIIGSGLRCSVVTTFTRGQHVVVNPQKNAPRASPMSRQDNGCGLLAVPPVRVSVVSTVGRRAFPVFGACTWNDLPCTVTRGFQTASQLSRHSCSPAHTRTSSLFSLMYFPTPSVGLIIIKIIQATLRNDLMMMMKTTIITIVTITTIINMRFLVRLNYSKTMMSMWVH